MRMVMVLVASLACGLSTASADTPSGLYRLDEELHDSRLDLRVADLPTCSEFSQGGLHRVEWKKGEGPTIEYVKSAHRVIVGRTLFDFIGDDETEVSATRLNNGLLTYAYFYRPRATAAALKLIITMLVDDQVVCGDVYWFKGSYAAP